MSEVNENVDYISLIFLFMYGLINDVVSTSDYSPVTLNGRIKVKLSLYLIN
jgi:hypothetical protein